MICKPNISNAIWHAICILSASQSVTQRDVCLLNFLGQIRESCSRFLRAHKNKRIEPMLVQYLNGFSTCAVLPPYPLTEGEFRDT